MQQKKYFLLAISLCLAGFCIAQNAAPAPALKGKFYFFWGYNRGYYTRSDLHLKGQDYDFTLYNIAAKDRQTPFSANVYLNPSKLTVPQCNYGIGFYLNDQYSLSLSADHMKYVMVQNQSAIISGNIATGDTPYNGTYQQSNIVVSDSLLTFEHTDGLNYIVVELNRTDNLLPLFTQYKGRNIEMALTEGIGIGALLPRTNAKLLSAARNDAYHWSGYGVSLKVGVAVTFFRHFFLSAHLKAGFIHMPDIRTTASASDRASQRFGFLQDNVLLGWRF